MTPYISGGWPTEQIAATSKLVAPELERVEQLGPQRRYSFYRHVPVADRESIVEHAEQFARDVDFALRLMCFVPLDEMPHGHLHTLGDPVHLITDDGGAIVRHIGGHDVVTLRSFAGISRDPVRMEGQSCRCDMRRAIA